MSQLQLYNKPPKPGYLGGYNWSAVAVGLLVLVLANFFCTQYIANQFQYQPALGQPLVRLRAGAIYPPFAWVKWGWQHMTDQDAAIRAPFLRGMLVLVAGSFLSIGVFFAMTNRRARRLSRNAEHLHGSARWAEQTDILASGLLTAHDGVFVGGWSPDGKRLNYLRHNGPEHVLVFAPTRSGKGVSLVIPTLLAWSESAIVYDIKGENWAKTAGFRAQAGHICLKFAPEEAEVATRFNPLSEVRIFTLRDVSDAQNIATMIIQTGEDPTSENAAYFQEAACSITSGLILHACYAAALKGRQATLADLSDLYACPGESFQDTLADLLNFEHDPGGHHHWKMPDGSPTVTHPVVRKKAQEMLNKFEKDFSGVLSTATTALAVYCDPLVARNTAGFGPAYAQKAKALVRASFDMGESARYRVVEQVDSELLNYLYAAISCVGHGLYGDAAWILRLFTARCPSFLAENESRFVVDLISAFIRSALERRFASGSFEVGELELIEAIDMFRGAVDTTEGYQRESLARAALSNVRDAATKSMLEQALSKNSEMMTWRGDGIVSNSSFAAEGRSVGAQAVDLLVSGMIAFENGRFEEAGRHFEQIRARKDELANHHVWPVFLREEGALLSSLGRNEEAYDGVSEALSVFERTGDAQQKAITLRVLSGIYRDAGKPDAAVVLLRESLKSFIEQAMPDAAAECILNLGTIDFLAGRYQSAQTLFREALSLFHLSGLGKNSEYSASFNLALTEMAIGRVEAGLLKLLECAAVTRDRHLHVFVACCWHIAQNGKMVDRVWLERRAAAIIAMSLEEIKQIADAHASELTGLPLTLDPS
jgi:tetratricopeptide (TPR) repeat protein